MINTDTARERRLRYRAKREGLALQKSRIRNPIVRDSRGYSGVRMDDFGGYRLIDPNGNWIVFGERFELDLDDVKRFLEGSTESD